MSLYEAEQLQRKMEQDIRRVEAGEQRHECRRARHDGECGKAAAWNARYKDILAARPG